MVNVHDYLAKRHALTPEMFLESPVNVDSPTLTATPQNVHLFICGKDDRQLEIESIHGPGSSFNHL